MNKLPAIAETLWIKKQLPQQGVVSFFIKRIKVQLKINPAFLATPQQLYLFFSRSFTSLITSSATLRGHAM